jgi:hypothetical protein
MDRRRTGSSLLVVGLALLLIGVGADLLGGDPGLGTQQLIALVAGVLLSAGGILLLRSARS